MPAPRPKKWQPKSPNPPPEAPEAPEAPEVFPVFREHFWVKATKYKKTASFNARGFLLRVCHVIPIQQ